MLRKFTIFPHHRMNIATRPFSSTSNTPHPLPVWFHALTGNQTAIHRQFKKNQQALLPLLPTSSNFNPIKALLKSSDWDKDGQKLSDSLEELCDHADMLPIIQAAAILAQKTNFKIVYVGTLPYIKQYADSTIQGLISEGFYNRRENAVVLKRHREDSALTAKIAHQLAGYVTHVISPLSLQDTGELHIALANDYKEALESSNRETIERMDSVIQRVLTWQHPLMPPKLPLICARIVSQLLDAEQAEFIKEYFPATLAIVKEKTIERSKQFFIKEYISPTLIGLIEQYAQINTSFSLSKKSRGELEELLNEETVSKTLYACKDIDEIAAIIILHLESTRTMNTTLLREEIKAHVNREEEHHQSSIRLK